jgi:thiol-disulfide isomerase/thioredoxin
MSCLVAKPVVDGIERELRGRASVYRVNAVASEGRTLVARYGVRFLPTLVVLDGQGEVVLQQVGLLSKAPVVDAVAEQLAPVTID